jgi:hypothetical protein
MTAIAAEPASALLTSPHADLSMLAGTWLNTNERSAGLVKLVMARREHDLTIDLFGAGENGPVEWGAVPATVFFERNDEGVEQPFSARYELGFMTVSVQGFLRQGVLVILSFTRFNDGSPRSNYFSKEFFFRS